MMSSLFCSGHVLLLAVICYFLLDSYLLLPTHLPPYLPAYRPTYLPTRRILCVSRVGCVGRLCRMGHISRVRRVCPMGCIGHLRRTCPADSTGRTGRVALIGRARRIRTDPLTLERAS